MTFEEELSEHGFFIYTSKGDSMRPLIRPGRDILEIGARRDVTLKKYDVVLYKTADCYIIHRIIRIHRDRDGISYSTLGDHNLRMEHGIQDGQVVGILTGLVRDGNTAVDLGSFRYRLYVFFRCRLYPLRIASQYIINIAGSLCRKIARVARRRG